MTTQRPGYTNMDVNHPEFLNEYTYANEGFAAAVLSDDHHL